MSQLPMVDISAHQLPTGEMEVRLRPDAFFDGVLSSVVFTLRWDDAEGVSLGEPVQDLPQLQYCAVSRSGPEQVSGGQRYQIFAGFGAVPFTSVGASWQADEEVVLCRIPLQGMSSTCALSNDAWTLANNGGYFISLNGEDRTGEVYETSTGLEPFRTGLPIEIHPNPASDRVELRFLNGPGPEASLRIRDNLGRLIWSLENAGQDLGGTKVIPTTTWPGGSYFLEMDQPTGRWVRQFVIVH